MSHSNLARLIVPIIAVVSLAHSEQLLAQPVEGTYELGFFFDGELVLNAHVEDEFENPAPGGSVVFQYCSLKGIPNDITQPDEAPSSACADGSGHWATVGKVSVDSATGDAFLNFGIVSFVEVIGFRYRYIGQGSGIANKLIDPVDWIAD